MPREAVAVDVGAAKGVYSWFLARYARECHARDPAPGSARASMHTGELELRIPIVAGVPNFGWATAQPTNTFAAYPIDQSLSLRWIKMRLTWLSGDPRCRF
jgi:hypothetical protein